jgi:chromosome partitioning protein
MSHCIVTALINQKGGVGKSTTAANLSAGLALRGKKVLAVDCDPQGNLTTSLGIDEAEQDNLKVTLANVMVNSINDELQDPTAGIIHIDEGFDLMPANIELAGIEMILVTAMNREKALRGWIDRVKHNYDFVIIDCMPSLGMITINALAGADNVIIPVQSQYLSAKGMTELVKTVNKVKNNINKKLSIQGILFTLVDRRTNLAKETIQEIHDAYGSTIPVLNPEIPLAVAAANASKAGKSLFAYDPTSKITKAYGEFAKEVDNAAKNRQKSKATLTR